jgi:PAS domain S-box-containing protein
MTIPSLAIFGWLKTQNEKQTKDLAAASTMEVARGVALAEQMMSSSVQSFLKQTTRSKALREMNLEACERLFGSQLQTSGIYKDILLLDEAGKVLASGTPEASRTPEAFRAAYPLELRRIGSVVDILPSLPIPAQVPQDSRKYRVVPYVLELEPDETLSSRYFLVALVDTGHYETLMRSLHFSGTWRLYLLDVQGTSIFSYPGNDVAVSAETWQKISEQGDEGWFQGLDDAGSKRIFGFAKLSSPSSPSSPSSLSSARPYVTVVTAYDEASALEGGSTVITNGTLLIVCVIAAGGVFAIRFGTRWLALPLEKILSATRRFASGELKARSNVDYKLGEIGMLARAFDEMADILELRDAEQRALDAKLNLHRSRLEDMVKQRTEALEESRNHARLILDSTSEGIVELDMQYRIAFANSAALSILGGTEEEFLFADFFEKVPLVNRDGALCEWDESPLFRALKGKQEAHVPGLGFRRQDGSWSPVNIYVAPVPRRGQQTGFVLAFLDLTNMIETHEMMDAIYRTTNNGYLTITEDLEVIDCNPAMARILNAKNEQEILDNYSKFFPAFQTDGVPSLERYSEAVHRALEEGFAALEWVYVDAARNLIPCDLSLTLIRVNQRRLVVASVHDLRDQRKAQDALDQQREQLQNMLNSTPIVLALIADEKIDVINKNGTALLGVSAGDPVASIYASPEEQALVFQSVLHNEPIHNWPIKLKDKKGNQYETLLSLRPFFYDGKKGLLAWVVNVTDLTRARQAAEQAARTKSEFLASMSHEIRTPMNAILGMSHLCLQTQMTEKQRNYLSKIHAAATSLLSIINDVLDFSKIEAGKLTLEKASFRLSEILKSVRDLVAFNAEKKNVLFSFDVDKNIQEYLVGDSLRLQQILINLCNNSVKFTERGKIVLRVSSEILPEEWDDRKRVLLHFAVEDTGIGMSEEQLARIFVPFTQADSSTTRKYGGSGLGLSICKHLVESMDGHIEAESVENRGSVFRFSVKMEMGEGKNGSSAIVDIQGLRVLVVDDDANALEILEETLLSLDLRVDTAGSGREALQKLRTAIDEKDPYAFLILDWRMPDLDGEGTVLRLREDVEKEVQPLVVMVSAYDDEECRAVRDKLQLNGFLSKPISRSDFYDTLIDILRRERQISDEQEREQEQEQERENRESALEADVLLVEDNLINQEIAIELLKQKGARVDVVNNGAEAIEAVKAKRYDLVFMDVQMPVMDGLEATRRIRELPGLEADRLPIVAMTAHAMQGDYEKSMVAGMNAHVTKPIDVDELYRTYYKWAEVGLQARQSELR